MEECGFENYKYTKDWFIYSEIRSMLLDFIDTQQKNTILEIGSYEGISSVFFADNLIDNPDSTLTCVDPFLTIDNNDHLEYLINNEEMNFDYNISICKNTEKIKVMKITSDKFFETNTKMFNFIYIDGCHEPDFVIRDMENSFKFLEKHGIMWMDDYDTGAKNAMDNFLEKYEGQYEIFHKWYQLGIIKL